MSKRKAPEKIRILAVDTSLGAPGVAVIDITDRKPTLVDVDHIKTTSEEPYVLRAKYIESWLHLFIRKYLPFNHIVRESFNAKYERSNYPIFSAWSAVDRVLWDFSYIIVEDSVSPTKVKAAMTDKARKVTKEEVADGVRKFIDLPAGFTFKKDDESDAVAIGLAWALENGLIDDVILREKKTKKTKTTKSKRKNTKEA